MKWSKNGRNFAHFDPPNAPLGGPSEFLKLIYKIQPVSDHVTKFQGDRSRDLGERVAKQKKTSAAEDKPIRTDVLGSLITANFNHTG